MILPGACDLGLYNDLTFIQNRALFCCAIFVFDKFAARAVDVKPENVLLVPGSSEMRPEIKIVDFGNACIVQEQTAKAIQTREYRSPEALLGAWPYSTAVDLWSVGAMIFELLTVSKCT